MQSQTNISKASRRTKALALSAMFACLALIFSYVEAMIPFNIGIPGVKLGLANLVVVIALYEMNFRYAFVINVIRILIAGLLFSGVFGALYSLAGGVLSLLVMGLLKKTDLFSIVSNLRMFLYFPTLMFSGIASGILMGVTAYIIDRKIPKSIFR